MNIKQHANVITADQQKVGKVRRLVMEPHNKELTHIVVRIAQFLALPEDKVVPIASVESANEGQVTLRAESKAFEALPAYEEKIDWDNCTPDLANAPRLTTQLPDLKLNIPKASVVVSEGARVMSADNQRVGSVEEVQTELKADRAAYFVIADGLFNKTLKQVPADWVDDILDDEIRLTVNAETINALQTYAR